MKKVNLVIELSGLLIIALVSNKILFPEDLGFFNISPHPYWLAVLLLSLRYPLAVVITAASCFSLLYCILFYLSPHCIDLEHLLELKNLTVPFSFPMVAFVISITFNKKEQLIATLKASETQLHDKIEQMGKTLKFDEQLNRELEHKIISQTNTIAKVFEISKIMESLDPQEVLTGLLEILHFHLNVKKSLVYLVKGTKLSVLTSKGWSSPPAQGKNEKAQGIVNLSLNKKRVMWIQDLPEKKTGQVHEPICCGPILLANNRIYALVCINEIPFISFTKETINFFTILLQWTSRSLTKISEHTIKTENEMYDISTGIFNFSYMKKVFKLELEHYKRSNTAVSIIVLKFKCKKRVNSKNVNIILKNILHMILKKKAMIAKYKWENSFFLFLPDVNRQDADSYAVKVKDYIYKFYQSLVKEKLLEVNCAVATISSNTKSATLDTEKLW